MFRAAGMLLIAILLGPIIPGCDEHRQVSKSSATTQQVIAPATEPSDDGAADAAAQPATRPNDSRLTIDGKTYSFPPAQVRVRKANGRIVVRLYSNDPKAALADDYKGNGYDLVMRLDDVKDPLQVYMAQWDYKALSRDYPDSPYGIFLEGTKFQLVPMNATVKFWGTPALVTVNLEGEFLQFDTADQASAPKSVLVKGSVLAPVEYKE